MLADSYLGIKETYTSEYRASGSKFYGSLFPISSPEEFEQKIKGYKEEFADATHVCSGCVIGIEREYQRCSDDGEPSNSSGRPILNALLSKGITNIGCAVVRYYGGKKLGIPGLIEAYGGAAEESIQKATILELVETEKINCSIPEDISYHVFNFLGKHKDVDYTYSDGQFTIVCAKSMTSDLVTELKKIPNLAIDL